MSLILHYKRLQTSAIDEIFLANIKRLREAEKQQQEASGEPPIYIVERDVMRFAADHCRKHPRGKGAWNGRQIRNAFLMAASRARHEAMRAGDEPGFQPQLRYSHFQGVEKLTEEYNRFRVQLQGGDDSRKALLNEERNDEFENDEEVEEAEEARRVATISRLDLAKMMYVTPLAQAPLGSLTDGRVSSQASTPSRPVYGQTRRHSPSWGESASGSSAFGGAAALPGMLGIDSTERSHFVSQGRSQINDRQRTTSDERLPRE